VVGACGRSSSDRTQTGASVAQAGGAAKVDKAADEAALRATFQKMTGELMAGDTTAFAAHFLEDGLEIMPGTPPAKGPAAVAKELASVLASMKNVKITFGEPAVTIADAGDLAVLATQYRMTYVDAKRKAMEDHGSSMTVFKKVNGQWQILYDTNVSEVAPGQ
jgi:uncharacterized protein (TIGR02246 family)